MITLETSRLWTDVGCEKILLSTMGKPKSTRELSNVLGIPVSNCYRRIKLLVDSGLMFSPGDRISHGRRIRTFKSNIKSVLIKFDMTSVRGKVKMNDGTIQKLSYNVEMPILLQMAWQSN